MTDEQKAVFKKLSKKYGLGPDDYAELTFLALGIEYELPENAFEMLVNKDIACAVKHLYLMANVIGVGTEKVEINGKWKLKDEVLNLIKVNLGNKNTLLGEYSRVSQIINDDSSLSAAQIYQLRKAVEVKMPEAEIIRMYYSGKDPAQMEKTIEYNVLVREIRERVKNEMVVEESRWSKFNNWIKKHKIIVGAIAVALFIIIGIALFLLFW